MASNWLELLSQSIYCVTVYLIFVKVTDEIASAISGKTTVKVYEMVKQEAARMLKESEATQ